MREMHEEPRQKSDEKLSERIVDITAEAMHLGGNCGGVAADAERLNGLVRTVWSPDIGRPESRRTP